MGTLQTASQPHSSGLRAGDSNLSPHFSLFITSTTFTDKEIEAQLGYVRSAVTHFNLKTHEKNLGVQQMCYVFTGRKA